MSRFARWHLSLVAAAALVCTVNTIPNDFTYDDIGVIVKSRYMTPAEPWSALWTLDYWTLGHPDDEGPLPEIRDLLYRPLTHTTFRLNYVWTGLNAWSYHLVNVLLHVAASVMVALLGRRMSFPDPAPLLAGLFFAVMPIHTEAVANVCGRSELLAAGFTLAGLLLAIRDQPRSTGALILWSAAASLCCGAAVLSKEVGAAAFPLVLLYAWNRGADGLRWRRRGMLLTGFAIVGCLYVALRLVALSGRLVESVIPSDLVNPIYDATALQRFWTSWKLLGLHIAKTFVPLKLCLDYSYRAISLANGPWDFHVLLGLGAAGSMVAAALVSIKRKRCVALLVAGCFLTYVPVSNAFLLMKTFYAERTWYSPSIFVALLVGLAFVVGARRLHSPSRSGSNESPAPLGRPGALVVCGIVLLATIRCWFRNAEWYDNGTLFASGYRDYPESAQVLSCYGSWLMEQGRLEESRALFEQAIAIHPGHTKTQRDLGAIYDHFGQYKKAAAHFTLAVMQDPGHISTRERLQTVSDKLAALDDHHLSELEQQYRDAPNDPTALKAWIDAMIEMGNSGEALRVLDQVKSSFPDSAAFEHWHAVVCTLNARVDRAIQYYKRSLELDPTQGQVAAELAMMFLERRSPGDVDEADRWTRHAVEVDPLGAAANMARAEYLANVGRIAEAVALYRRLIDRNAPDDPLRETWERRLAILER